MVRGGALGRVSALGFRVWGIVEVESVGFKNQGLEFSLEFGVWGHRVWGLRA